VTLKGTWLPVGTSARPIFNGSKRWFQTVGSRLPRPICLRARRVPPRSRPLLQPMAYSSSCCACVVDFGWATPALIRCARAVAPLPCGRRSPAAFRKIASAAKPLGGNEEPALSHTTGSKSCTHARTHVLSHRLCSAGSQCWSFQHGSSTSVSESRTCLA